MDLNAYRQLPIPEWLGLVCPQCEYPLRGLPEHQCPECGLRFNIDDLITPAVPLRPPEITPATRPVPDLGVTCQECDSPLAGAAGNECPQCGQLFDLAEYIPDSPWPEVAPAANVMEKHLLVSLLRDNGLPCTRLDRLDQLGYGYVGSAPLVVRVRQDYYLDALSVITANHKCKSAAWRCANCGRKVPGNFEVCWKCQTPR